MTQNGTRYQAWKDALSNEELEIVERAEEMPPSMAIGYVLVTLKREIDELRRPLWKQALAPAAVAGAFVASLLGFDPRGLAG